MLATNVRFTNQNSLRLRTVIQTQKPRRMVPFHPTMSQVRAMHDRQPDMTVCSSLANFACLKFRFSRNERLTAALLAEGGLLRAAL